MATLTTTPDFEKMTEHGYRMTDGPDQTTITAKRFHDATGTEYLLDEERNQWCMQDNSRPGGFRSWLPVSVAGPATAAVAQPVSAPQVAPVPLETAQARDSDQSHTDDAHGDEHAQDQAKEEGRATADLNTATWQFKKGGN